MPLRPVGGSRDVREDGVRSLLIETELRILVVSSNGSGASARPAAPARTTSAISHRFTRRPRAGYDRAAAQRRLDAIRTERHDAQPDAGGVEDGVAERRWHGGRGGLADAEGRLVETLDHLQLDRGHLVEAEDRDSRAQSRLVTRSRSKTISSWSEEPRPR